MTALPSIRLNITVNRLSTYRAFTQNLDLGFTDVSEIADRRTAMIADVFNGNGFPTVTEDLNESVTSGSIHGLPVANLSGYNTITRLRYTFTDYNSDTWTHYVYKITPTATSNNKAIILSGGHGSENVVGNNYADYDTTINQALGYGYTVFWRNMPIAQNSDNTETASGITGSGTSGHNRFDNNFAHDNYNPFELFFFDISSVLNDEYSNFTNWYMIGLSGGGWTTTVYSAMDARIEKAFANEGVRPRSTKSTEYGHPTAVVDYEQGSNANLSTVNSPTRVIDFYRSNAYSYENCMFMAAYPNRVFYWNSNEYYPSGFFNYDHSSIFATDAQADISSFGGKLLYEHINDITYNTHRLHLPYRTSIFTELGDI